MPRPGSRTRRRQIPFDTISRAGHWYTRNTLLA